MGREGRGGAGQGDGWEVEEEVEMVGGGKATGKQRSPQVTPPGIP